MLLLPLMVVRGKILRETRARTSGRTLARLLLMLMVWLRRRLLRRALDAAMGGVRLHRRRALPPRHQHSIRRWAASRAWRLLLRPHAAATARRHVSAQGRCWIDHS